MTKKQKDKIKKLMIENKELRTTLKFLQVNLDKVELRVEKLMKAAEKAK